MASFEVVVDGLESKQTHLAINASIQRAMLTHLAGLDAGIESLAANGIVLTPYHTNGVWANPEIVRGEPAAESHEELDAAEPAGDAPLGQFVVSLRGIDLPAGAEQAIERDIRAAVLPHLATIDYGEDRTGAAILSPTWRGVWYRELDDSIPRAPSGRPARSALAAAAA